MQDRLDLEDWREEEVVDRLKETVATPSTNTNQKKWRNN